MNLFDHSIDSVAKFYDLNQRLMELHAACEMPHAFFPIPDAWIANPKEWMNHPDETHVEKSVAFKPLPPGMQWWALTEEQLQSIPQEDWETWFTLWHAWRSNAMN